MRMSARPDGSTAACVASAHSEFRVGTARCAQQGRFLSRTWVPVHHGEAAARRENLGNDAAQELAVGNAVKHICQEDKIHRIGRYFRQIISVRLCEPAVGQPGLREPAAAQRQKSTVDVYCRDVPGNPRHRQRKPSIADTQVDRLGAGGQPTLDQDASGIGPQCLPPLRIRHLRAPKDPCCHGSARA